MLSLSGVSKHGSDCMGVKPTVNMPALIAPYHRMGDWARPHKLMSL